MRMTFRSAFPGKASINEWNCLATARFGAELVLTWVAGPKSFGPGIVDPFSLMLPEKQHVQSLEQPMCRGSRRHSQVEETHDVSCGTGRAKPVARVARTAILIDILIRTVASR